MNPEFVIPFTNIRVQVANLNPQRNKMTYKSSFPFTTNSNAATAALTALSVPVFRA